MSMLHEVSGHLFPILQVWEQPDYSWMYLVQICCVLLVIFIRKIQHVCKLVEPCPLGN